MTLAARIRRQLENPDGLTLEALQPLAQEYREAVDTVNTRLWDCIALLRKGLRSEAIQRANLKPNIFDAAAAIDVADMEEWIDILRFYGIPSPPLLDASAITELNEALVDEQPLEELLRQHRRLAIAKAPLGWRLKVLRKIAEIDAMNTVWYDDVVQWETIRLKQIAGELNQAIESNSPDAIVGLEAELSFKHWKVQVPDQLINKVRTASARKVFDKQLEQAKAISETLHSAFSEGNQDAAIAAAGAWNTLVSQIASPIPDELQQEVAPALEWVQSILEQRSSEEEYDRRSQHLEGLLQKETSSKEELQQAMHSLVRMDLGIEPILQGRYNARINELTVKARRRQQLRIVSVVAALIALLVFGGLWYWWRSYQASVSEASVALRSMMDSGKLVEAEGLFKKLAPNIQAAPSIASIEQQMNALLKEEQIRQDQVKRLIEEAESEDPAKIDISKVNQAINMAKTTEENNKLTRLRQRWESGQSDLENKDVEAIQDKVKEFEAEFTNLQNQPVVPQSLERLEALLVELRKLSENYPRGARRAAKLLDFAIERGEGLRGNLQNKLRTMSQLDSIMDELRSSNSIANYERNLKRYSEKIDEPTATELKLLLKIADKWTSIEKFNSMNDELSSKPDQNLSVGDIKSAKKTRTELDGIISNLPGKANFEKFLVIARYGEEREDALQKLRDEAAQLPFSGIVTLVNQGINKRFFTSDEARNQYANEIARAGSTTKLEIPLVIDSSGNLGSKTIRGKLEVKPEPRNTIKSITQGGEAAQNQMLSRWDDAMLKQVGEVMKNENLDSTIKRRILAMLLKASSSGSRGMDLAFSQVKSMLTTEDDEKLWYVDKTFESSLGADLEAELKKAAIEAKKLRAEDQETIKAFARPRLVFVGGVLPKEGAVSEPTITLMQPPDGTIHALSSNPGSTELFELVRIGRLQKGVIIRDNSNNSDPAPWEPLFCEPSRP